MYVDKRQILAKTRNMPNSPNIIACQNLLIYIGVHEHLDIYDADIAITKECIRR